MPPRSSGTIASQGEPALRRGHPPAYDTAADGWQGQGRGGIPLSPSVAAADDPKGDLVTPTSRQPSAIARA